VEILSENEKDSARHCLGAILILPVFSIAARREDLAAIALIGARNFPVRRGCNSSHRNEASTKVATLSPAKYRFDENIFPAEWRAVHIRIERRELAARLGEARTRFGPNHGFCKLEFIGDRQFLVANGI